jgi:hypothetical protein
VRSRAQRAQARVLEEHVLQNVAVNLVHDPGRSAGVEEGHGVEIGGSEGDADMAYAVGVAARTFCPANSLRKAAAHHETS